MIITSVQKPPGPFEIVGSNAIFYDGIIEGTEIDGTTGNSIQTWTYDQYTLPVRPSPNLSAKIASDYKNWLSKAKQHETDNQASKIREYRNSLLDECDKTFCNVEQWTKMEEAEQAIWTKYKQDLRDISLQPGFPYNIVFPIAPAKKFGGDHLTAIMADGTEISLISAEQNAIYIDGQRCLTLELCTDAGTHQDQELRNIFLDPDKSKSITIEKEKYEGFTKLIRSVYEAGKITIIVAQKTNEASAELQEQVTAQQEAISILMGGTYNG